MLTLLNWIWRGKDRSNHGWSHITYTWEKVWGQQCGLSVVAMGRDDKSRARSGWLKLKTDNTREEMLTLRYALLFTYMLYAKLENKINLHWYSHQDYLLSSRRTKFGCFVFIYFRIKMRVSLLSKSNGVGITVFHTCNVIIKNLPTWGWGVRPSHHRKEWSPHTFWDCKVIGHDLWYTIS